MIRLDLYHLWKIKYWLCFSAIFFSAQVSANPTAISFDNFNSTITLTEQQDHYLVNGRSKKVKLANRLIVTTAKNVNKIQLQQYNKLITQVSELYIGTTSNFYLLELDIKQYQYKQHRLLVNVMQSLQTESGIKSVQPDILQLNHLQGRIHKIGHVNEHDIVHQATISNSSLAPVKKSAKQRHTSYLSQKKIRQLWQTTKGAGVNIAIIDDGFNLEHPDLQQSAVFSYDSETKKLSAAPQRKIDSHGTKVAGIIFSAHNNIGIDGIAPEANFIALRQPDTWTSNTLLSLQLAKLAGADIINCSWNSPQLMQPVAEVVTDLAKHGREGKGIAVIFAAGNIGINIPMNSTEASIEAAIVVGAANKQQRLAFSNYGKTVDIYAEGNKTKTTIASGQYGELSGTSLAAAIVSGTSALLLAKSPEMNVQQLLIKLKEHNF